MYISTFSPVNNETLLNMPRSLGVTWFVSGGFVAAAVFTDKGLLTNVADSIVLFK